MSVVSVVYRCIYCGNVNNVSEKQINCGISDGDAIAHGNVYWPLG